MFKNINCKNLPSLRRNIVYQFLYELLIVFIPLFTIPYVSRVLGAENIGLFSYTYAVANYFVLFANLGIKNYGSRTIAMVRNNKEELNRNFSEILSIHIIFSIIVIFVYLVLLFFFVEDNLVIFLIQSIYVFAAVFDINWFFFGIEKFKLTVGRNTLVKILSVFLVLVFVKTQTDLWIYALILALSVFVGQSVVWFALKQYVSWRRPSWANMKQHIRPLFVLFLPILALSLYKYMDKIMLGSISSNVQVGFYENAEKIINVPMSLIMAFGVVLMPRIANMVTSKDKGEVFKLIDMSMEAVMLLAIAISFGLAGISFVLAPIFFGYEFEECGILIMGLAVTVPFMAFANVIRTQYLIPYKEDKIFVVSLFLGADSVYFGADLFSARAFAHNFNLDELKNAIEYAKLRGVKTNLTLNTLLKDDEFDKAINLAIKAYEFGIDAIIVQDLGLAMKLISLIPDLPIHASTQMTIHNLNGALELQELGFKRVVLSRELSIDEINHICKNTKLETECFIHGALCISYSGQCLFSSLIGGRSGNRGKCAGPCRLPYELLENDKKIDSGYLLNTRDLCGLEMIPSLLSARCNLFKNRRKNEIA